MRPAELPARHLSAGGRIVLLKLSPHHGVRRSVRITAMSPSTVMVSLSEAAAERRAVVWHRPCRSPEVPVCLLGMGAAGCGDNTAAGRRAARGGAGRHTGRPAPIDPGQRRPNSGGGPAPPLPGAPRPAQILMGQRCGRAPKPPTSAAGLNGSTRPRRGRAPLAERRVADAYWLWITSRLARA